MRRATIREKLKKKYIGNIVELVDGSFQELGFMAHLVSRWSYYAL